MNQYYGKVGRVVDHNQNGDGLEVKEAEHVVLDRLSHAQDQFELFVLVAGERLNNEPVLNGLTQVCHGIDDQLGGIAAGEEVEQRCQAEAADGDNGIEIEDVIGSRAVAVEVLGDPAKTRREQNAVDKHFDDDYQTQRGVHFLQILPDL